jgi:release factor glutamine methyltransferase
MPETETWTIGRLLTWTTDFLKTHGAASPRLDAEVLLAEARHCERIELYTAFDEVASEEIRVAFRELVRRRAEGMPVAYLVGRREFYAMAFHVTPAVLIPRPETEFVLITLLDLVKNDGKGAAELRIADVGTGSGILAICAARQLPSSTVTALDISPEALDIARRNANTHQVSDRIEFVQSDLFAGAAPGTYDYIVSNPPYIADCEYDQLLPDVRDYEPREALLAGPTGTEIIQRLLQQAGERLTPGGWLVFEISPMIETAVVELITGQGVWESVDVIKDLAGLARVVKLRRKAG